MLSSRLFNRRAHLAALRSPWPWLQAALMVLVTLAGVMTPGRAVWWVAVAAFYVVVYRMDLSNQDREHAAAAVAAEEARWGAARDQIQADRVSRMRAEGVTP